MNPDDRMPLIELLEREVRDGLDTFGGEARDVPLRLWESALLAPTREFLLRPGKAFRARLVATCWQLAGGHEHAMPEELPLVVELLHAGSLIVDDIQDQSEHRRGRPSLHRLYGTPLALNTGNWMYFWSLVVLGRHAPPTRSAAICGRATATLMRCHQGQALDLSTRVFTVQRGEVARTVSATTGLKTGALMEFAARLGAMCAEAPDDRCEALGRFGYDLGVGLQMLDDLGGLVADERRHKGLEDLRGARLTWPWAWLAESADEARFAGLVAQARAIYTGDTGDGCRGDGCRADNRSGADPDPQGELALQLRASLADEVVGIGREQVSGRLRSALDQLHTCLGDSAPLEALQHEVRRLETSYGC